MKCQNGEDFKTFQKNLRKSSCVQIPIFLFSLRLSYFEEKQQGVGGKTGTSFEGLHHIEAQLWRVFQRLSLLLNSAFFSSFEALNWHFPPFKWSSFYFEGAHCFEGKFDWCCRSLTWTPCFESAIMSMVRNAPSVASLEYVHFLRASKRHIARKALINAQMYVKEASITPI